MGKINIKNGTPVGSTSMCDSCRYAHIMRGFRESELVVLCDYTNQPIAVPFKLSQCSNYMDKNRPNWDQMEKLAIDVLPISSAKSAGFHLITLPSSPKEVEQEEAADSINLNE